MTFNPTHPMIKYIDDATVTDEGQYRKPYTDGSIPTKYTRLQDDADRNDQKQQDGPQH